ncbi:MAG: hypothetical protein AAB467_05255 [Patescibacteria group bacterium]
MEFHIKCELQDLILAFSLKEKETIPLSSKERRGEVQSSNYFLTSSMLPFI